ncbi:unnamed protein product [Heterobilharzia americana]|nr:unnamed protein product [Heterobilharzia americana]
MGHRLNIVNLTDNETVSIDTDNIIQLNNVHSSNSVSQNLHNIQRADILLRLSLCLLTMVYEVKRIKSESNNTNNRLPLPSQMKAVRCAGNSLIIHLFSSKWLCEIEFWNNNHSDNDILKRSTCVKQVCCNPFVLNDILTTSCLSINHLLIQLGSLWSSSSSYLVDEFFEKPLVQTFLILLNNHYCGTRKLNNNVIEKLVEIIHNLVFLPDVCSKGRRLLFPFHSKVVSYLHKRLQELCQVKATFFANLGKQPQSGLRLQREFRLVGYLAQLPHECVVIDECEDYINCLSSTEGEQLLHALLQLLSRSAIRYLHTTTNSTRSTVFKRRALVNSDESAARYDLQLATGEAVEAELIQSILHLIPIISNVSEYLKKVLNLFVCSKSRVARSLLCRVVSISLSRLPNFPLNLFDTLKSLTQSNSTTGQNELTVDSLRYFTMYLSSHNHANDAIVNLTENILIMLNSWDENYIEQPDVNKRVTGFNLLIDLCLLFKLIHPPEQTLILHIAGLNCAIYTICHEDLQLRDISLNYIINVIESIEKRLIYQQLNETDIYYQELIIKCIWHNLVICLRDSSIYLSYKRLHLLRLLNTIIHIHKSRSHFSSLALLIDNHSSNNDFYTNLQSNSLSRQCCAIRRLGLFLHNPITIISRQQLTNHLHSLNQQSKNCPIKQKDLRELFLPILWFYLEPELNCPSETSNSHKLDKHKKLYEYCLDAIGALAKHLHWRSYRILLESVISRLNSCINTNLVSQIIVNLIDAFQPPNWEMFSKSIDEQIKEEEDVNNSNLVHNIPASKILTRKISPENLNILNYMLSVVKRLEPFIVKPIKTKDNTGTSNDNQSTTTSQPLKISLVISLVMLLRRLPDGYLESRLPHLILRVVDILRPSRDINFEVRNEASKSLSRIARLLGPGKGLDKLFEVVTQQLNRGGYTYWQVRLYTLHRVLGEVEQAIISGEVAFKPGQLDNVGRILGRLYLDEIVGRLAEEMDSRRTSAKTLSETYNKGISTSELTEATSTSYLPEANGLKSPEGIARLCRLLSSDGIINLFNDIKIALSCAVSGSVLEQMLNNQSTSVNNLKSSSLSIGCGLRFRHRALARLECTLSRLSTKNAIFSNQYLKSNINTIIKLFQQLVNENLNEILILNENSQLIIDNNSMVINSNKNISRWLQPQSKPLEPRWHYLELENEPIHEYNSSITQSGLTQSHLMICCGLHLFIGLIRYHWLKPDNLDHLQLISSMIPSIIICLNSIYVQVLEVAVKCVRLLLLIATSKVTVSRIPKFHEYLNRIGEKLFDILANQPNNRLLSNKISSSNYYGENLASSLYRAFASLVRHQYGYPLSKTQLLTLLNAVDIELDRYAIVSPSLSLLHAIFQRRLRDPSIQTNDENFLNLDIDPEVNKELPVKGLIIARLSDCDHELNTGASGGSRLLDLFNRLQILAITSSSDQIRSEARCCLITFLLNYPHKVKFLQSFIAFCVRQLQYKTSAGRLSAASLLSGLISDLPITRLMGKNHMDEAILLSVGAAIERESDRKSRSTLLNLIRLLFSKLPSDTAQSYFNDYLLAFLTAPSETRCSARLLGLQMIISILDSQSCLSVSKLRNNLISILSNDVLPIAAIQVNKLVLSNPSIMIASGLNEFYNKGSKTKNPKEEYLLNKLIKEDAQWISDLKLETTQSDNEDYAEIAEDVEIMISSDEEMSISNEDDDDNDIDLDADTHSDPFTTTITEQQPSDIADTQQSTSFRKLKASKSAIKNQYFLAAYTMEQSLNKIVYFLAYTFEWTKYDTILPPITEFQSKKAQITLKKRREQYSTLFSTETITSKSEIKSKKFSLLVTGHRESREWATRCLSLLLRIEVNANKERFVKHVNTLNSESSGINVRSTIFKRLQKGKYGLNKVLQRLLDGLLFQLEVDARVPISEEWSNSIVSNLIYLGQLLHLTVGRKPVLRIFRVANKIALDELNNRPQYYCQRLMALKLITGLLLRLPHPDTNILFDMFSLTKSNDKVNELITDDTLKKKEEVPAYFAYLRSASKLLSREFRQRERLAFIAASSLSTNINDENTDIGARIRLRGNYLSKELTVRAKARRRRAQARLRRALMSGTIRPESAQSLVTSVSAGMAKAGPDQLVDLIESTESALTQELGGGNHQLIQIICTRASLGARIIRERRNLHKATRDALGIAWSGPVKKKLKLDVSPQSSSKGENFNLDTSPSPNQSCKRKRSSNEEHDEEEKIEIKAKKKSRKC